jgi:hypothetical protein
MHYIYVISIMLFLIGVTILFHGRYFFARKNAKTKAQYKSNVFDGVSAHIHDLVGKAMKSHPNSTTLHDLLMTLLDSDHEIQQQMNMLTDACIQAGEYADTIKAVVDLVDINATIIRDDYDILISDEMDIMFELIMSTSNDVYTVIADKDLGVSHSQLAHYMKNRVEVKTTELINSIARTRPDELTNHPEKIAHEIGGKIQKYIYETYQQNRTSITKTTVQESMKDMNPFKLVRNDKVSSISM